MHDTRDDIDPQYRFDLTRIFPTRDAWVDECDALADAIENFDATRSLGDVLREFESLSQRERQVTVYAALRADVATGDEERTADRSRADALGGDLKGVRETVERRLRDADRDAVPERFEAYAEDVQRRADHALDPAAADLLTDLDDVLDAPARVHRSLVDADFDPPTVDVDGEPVTLTRSERRRLLREGSRDTRRRVFEAVRDAFCDRAATLATNLDTMARRNVRLADARDYDSALHAALGGGGPDAACRPRSPLDPAVHDALVAGVRSNLDPKHRLERLRREALGVETLQPWDASVPPVSGDPPRYDFDEARELVVDAVAPLGDAYQSRLERLLSERRVDAFDHQGKTEQGAAYATNAGDAGPFVLARWDGSLSHLFLLAHELGHAVHFDYASEQPHVTAGIPLPTAELPSKLHEVLLADHMLAATSGEERASVAARAVYSVGSNLFYSARWAAFTRRLHERVADGHRLTPSWLDETYGDLYAEFNPVVDTTDRLRSGWTTGLYSIPLYHHYPYILGTAGALAVADGLGGGVSLDDYAAFLRAGTSNRPVELLDELGVRATSERAVSRAVSRFDDYVDALATASRR